MANGTLTADGSTGSYTIAFSNSANLHTSGSLGGGALALEVYIAETTSWEPLRNDAGVAYSYTTAVDIIIDVPDSTVIRGVLTGSTAPTLFYKFS